MFFLSLKNGNDDPTRDSFGKYYMPLIEVKDFNELTGNKQFFDHPVKKTGRVWKNVWNIMKRWLCNTKLIRLFVLTKIL